MNNDLKDIANSLSAGAVAISFLSFAEGLLLYSFNTVAFFAFCVAWLIFNALTEQIGSEARKLLVSFGVPASLASLAIVFLSLTLP
jgi:hypothetical protein